MRKAPNPLRQVFVSFATAVIAIAYLTGCHCYPTLSPAPAIEESVALFPFNANLADISGHINSGTAAGSPVGISYVLDRASRPNSALQLDGASWVTVPDKSDLNFDSTKSFTIVAWVYFTGAGPHSGGLVCKGPATGSAPGYQFRLNNNRLEALITSDDNFDFVMDTTDSLKPDVWNFVSMVVDQPQGIVFLGINNSRIVSKTGLHLNAARGNTADLLIGKDRSATGFFIGALDDVGIYSRALSSGELLTVQSESH
jgi:hypothetical protein